MGLEYLESLLELDQICYGGYWSLGSYEVELKRPNSYVIGGFPSHSNGLVGFGILWHILNEAHIISLAVHPDYRRQGLARQLVTYLLHIAIDLQSEWATLEVRVSNVAAQSLYEDLGFVLLGKRKKYYSDPEEDALIYWKKL